MRVMAFERDDIDARLPEPGERLLVLTPLRPQGLLPVRIGLDAVAVADMNSRFAFQAFSGSLQRRNAPALDVVEEDVEGRDRKSTRLNSSHVAISYAVFCLKKKKNKQ